MSERFISIVIPNYNGSATIGKCLEAAFASRYGNFEVVVADDCSTDDSVEIIRRYPCKLVRLEKHSGASAARNVGARNSRGELLFFTDADCLIREDALSLANAATEKVERTNAVIGGTYTPLPVDTGFFSVFQSLFVHYSETKKKEPDYIAGHAMVIDADLFRKSDGFNENFLPLSEDVDFSHRLRRSGSRLFMRPEIQVAHVFNFSLVRSLRNALRKSMYWTAYSLSNRDLLADSGTASTDLKINGACFFLNAFFTLLFLLRHDASWLSPVPILIAVCLFVNRGLIRLFGRAKGPAFAIAAASYYIMVYPLPVITGALAGIMRYLFGRKI